MNLDKNLIKKYLPYFCIYLIFMIVLGYFAAIPEYGFNSDSNIGLIPMGLLLVISFISVICVPFLVIFLIISIWVKSAKAKRKTVLLACLSLWFITLSLFLSFNVFLSFNSTATHDSSSTILQGLENYKKAKGVYPTSLNDLVPTYLDNIPITAKGNSFEYSSDGSSFRLFFFEDFGRYEYNPDKNDWIYHD